jgi:2-C-methyl-D-erythritol 4-phosphate cytidylyltransferase
MSPTPVPGVGLVVVAAGRGERLGADRPKALVPVAGRPLLVWALEGAAAAGFDEVVVVAPAEALAEVSALAPGAVVVPGGASRQESVAAGLAALPPVALVLVHDAARAFVPPRVFAAVVDALRAGAEAVVPGLAPPDTLRHLDHGPVDRARVVAVQTPQGFRREVLERAHAAGGAAATDDAGLVEATGVAVQVVPGSQEGFKVTRPLDVLLAEALVRARGGA